MIIEGRGEGGLLVQEVHSNSSQRTEVGFINFLSGGFTIATVVCSVLEYILMKSSVPIQLLLKHKVSEPSCSYLVKSHF